MQLNIFNKDEILIQISRAIKMDELFDDDIDIFFGEVDEEQLAGRKPSMSLPHSLEDNIKTFKTKHETDKYRINSKNKYVEKLKEYEVDPDNQNNSRMEEGLSVNEMGKRERNRLAAKQSRDRKKLYIELMERQQKRMNEELKQITRQIEDTKRRTAKFLSQNKTLGGFTRLSELQGRLQKILHSNKGENVDDEINIVLDSIRFRLGASGKERVNKVHECFKQIINLSLPALHRYILWAATQSKHLFRQSNHLQIDDFLIACHASVPELEEKIDDLKEVKASISSRKSQLLILISKLKESKNVFDRKNQVFDELVDEIRDALTPQQTARMVLWANKWKFREEINFSKFQAHSLKQEEEPLIQHQLPVKKHKKCNQN